jgi:hypothetical protein
MTLPSDLVSTMYADYQRGCSLAGLARAYGHDRGSLRKVFQRRGLAVRPPLPPNRHLPNGCWAPHTPATPAQIDVMIAGLTRIMIPPQLKVEWRHWPMNKRAEFIARARRKLKRGKERPQEPFSSNVEPFDYTTPRAWDIARAANAGHDSGSAPVKLKLASRGVIWHRRLFFWSPKGDGYYPGPFKPGTGRPALHHTIWVQHNGRPVPAGYTVICVDGNKNNLSPRNLGLRSRADCARQNAMRYRAAKSRRAISALLLNQQNGNHDNRNAIDSLRTRTQPAPRH